MATQKQAGRAGRAGRTAPAAKASGQASRTAPTAKPAGQTSRTTPATKPTGQAGRTTPVKPSGPARRTATVKPGAAPGAERRSVLAWFRTQPFQATTWILALLGMGVSIYLTLAHYTTAVTLACSANGLVNCEKVTTSSWSMVFGVFPVALLGLLFYVFMVAVCSPWAWQAKIPAIYWARLGAVIVGMGFVLYLLWAELIEIGNICLWCTSVHVLTFLLFGMLVFHASGKRDRDAALGR
jgi:uncharacterized membrane protein